MCKFLVSSLSMISTSNQVEVPTIEMLYSMGADEVSFNTMRKLKITIKGKTMNSKYIIALSLVLMALISISILTWGSNTKLANVVLANTNSTEVEKLPLEGKAFKYDSYHPYNIGFDLDNALASALSEMDEGYDLLVNSTVNVQSYYLIVYFSKYFTVQGTALQSAELKKQMSDEAYQNWLISSNVINIAGDTQSAALK
ncbi:hypothetical protein FX988_00918 [Paraglaciecola mesophila]|uniref:Uncharacterized protein n=2 Tax=Alteromonadales TaxID=135622 RepID=A0A857JHJ9_9ALTE|nr:hypothetical protein FX988_00918 [Paraglaciecola mesophila]